MLKFLWNILKDERGSTLAVTYSFSANTLMVASQMNTNFDDVEAIVNALTSTNYSNDSVGAAALASDVIRATYGLIQHTDGSLYIDVSDTNPCLEITDGGVRVKVDDSSIERVSGGLQVKTSGIVAAMLAGSIPDSKLNQLTTSNKVANSALVAITAANKVNTSSLTGSTYLPDNTVDTTALKTASAEYSSTGNTNVVTVGGYYRFMPKIKNSISNGDGIVGFGGRYNGNIEPGTAYKAYLNIHAVDGTMYAQFYYVTASGIDQWIFLLINKNTKELILAVSAFDHPSFGNGGDPIKLPHPFPDYDGSKHEVILLDKETCTRLKNEATEGRSILTLVNEEYKPDLTKEEVYVPLHSGKFLGQASVMIDTIPDYINVRKLTKLTKKEKDERKAKQEVQRTESEKKEQAKENNRITAKTKLESLLTKEEINAIFE